MRGLERKLVLSLSLGIVVVVALAAVTDLGRTAEAVRHFGWQYLPAALALTLLNYALRFVKWHYYLGLIGARGLGVRRSALIFFSAFSMVMTPGKVGEWLKSYLLRETLGTPVGVSAPIIIAERLTDGLAMVLLAGAGLFLYGHAWPVLVAALLPALAVVVLSQQRGLALALLRWAERLPLVSSRVHHLHAFYESARALFRLPNLALAVGIGVVSWAGESVAFYLILLGLGLAPSVQLLIQATFVLAIASLAGALALTPGGLAVAEGSIAGLLLLLGVTAEPATAAAATVLIRFCTLWFGVSIGFVTLLWAARFLAGVANGERPRGVAAVDGD